MRIFPVASDGWRFILPSVILGIGLFAVGEWWAGVLGTTCLMFAAFCLYFFRDFNRPTVLDENLIYCPGDGKIMDVSIDESGEYAGKKIIRVFLSVLDGHVQRVPVSGRVDKIAYKKGTFLDARHDRAHIDNEQNAVTLVSQKGTVVVKQIAGLIARRIVCWAKEGDTFEQGQRYGLIRFGSQVDVIMPKDAKVLVKKGDRVLGGKSVLAQWQ